MQKPTLGWQSWSPPHPKWHKLPHWDYSPFPEYIDTSTLASSRPLASSIRYWCSWYAYGTKINDHLINQTQNYIKDNHLNFSHILIDDGWCQWGDWLFPDSSKFSNFKETINKIKKQNIKAGLWFAPFLADKKSTLYQEKPSWFLTHHNKPIQGFRIMPLWDKITPQRYLLDFDQEDVRRFTKKWLSLAIDEWCIDLLKLDFLYAPYFDPNLLNPTKAKSHLNWLLSYIKKTYPHVQTIACGAPFADCHQLVDAIRVSKDTALPPVAPIWFNKLTYTSRVRMLHTTLKANINPKLNLDPDVRMFTLDNNYTNKLWSEIRLPILGIGDDLLQYDQTTIQKVKKCLKNHSSQS